MRAVLWIYESLSTLYLFTASDFSTVLLPQTLFALFSMLSGRFTASSWHDEPQIAFTTRLCCVVLWIWLQLLVLDLANQRLPDSVAEDIVNKPWRPITAGRITTEGTRQLLIASIAVSLAISNYLGVAPETLLLFTFNWLYNDLGLANGHWLLRNLMNALGITTIGAGATRVACHDLTFMAAPAARWWFLCGGMLMSTIHAQDLYDQQGDAVRGRSTAPLVLGDGAARWTVGAGVLFWSVARLHLCEDWFGYSVPVILGMVITVRILTLRDVSADKRTFKLWALWTVCLYSLPLLGRNSLHSSVRLMD
ncbi:UbiA prenyltransferase family [Xylaria bambusicola]|uniref:UbiA prenyltransferase family n=1 Tax=Xylaria bambusicola TaxID=326684 RepID=UPI002007918F|nr:UbiA prenyltransferase family [Xylaria bambusicola]KAI0509559.1 UbiA prenyltransferase family [Xylaria bambusicola]